MIYRLIILVGFIFSFLACSENNVGDFEIINGLNLESPPSYNQIYGIASSIVGSDDGDIESLIGYNKAQHSIDIFDVESKERTKLNLEREGPDAVDEIRFVQYISKDSILIASRDYILILNKYGDIFYKYSIKSNWNEDSNGVLSEFYEPYFVADEGVQAYFNKKSNEFYFALNYYKYPRFVSLENYQKEVVLFASLNLLDKSVKVVDIHYPEKIINNMYGALSQVYCDIDDEGIYYGVKGFPEIYKYDLNTRNNIVFGEFDKSIEPRLFLAGDDLLDHMLKYTHYLDIRINKHKGVIYRFINIPNDKGRHDLFLQEYSAVNYKLISEGGFPKWHSFFGVLMANTGMYVPIMNGEENLLSYAFIK